MAEPVKHDALSSVTTAAYETGKGGLKWGGVALGIAGAIGGAIALAAHASIGTALLVGLGTAAATGVAAVAFAPLSAIALGVVGIGALFGLAKGGDRVTRENQAFAEKVENRTQVRQQQKAQQMNNARMAGMQEGYGIGFREGQQAVVNQIQQMQYAAIQEEMAHQQQSQHGQQQGGHAAKVVAERAAQVGAQKTV